MKGGAQIHHENVITHRALLDRLINVNKPMSNPRNVGRKTRNEP
ncbi:hypothetical protein D083_0017 [Dickeya solani RNS 08.23.3.1.A]|nr:hypothetical protein D083_0017 [Dickeya solani RNS 08.23.3.1.A]